MSLHAISGGKDDDAGRDGDPNKNMIEELESWAEEMAGLSERIRNAAAQMRRGEIPHE